MSQYIVGYVGRTALGIGFALVFAAIGVILARMGILLFGVTSWTGWLSMLLGGIGIGAALGSVGAWLWLKGMSYNFTGLLALAALVTGISGAWFGYQYGSGVEPECCASPTMGPIAWSVLGAILFSNGATLAGGIAGQTVSRALRRRRSSLGLPPSQAHL